MRVSSKAVGASSSGRGADEDQAASPRGSRAGSPRRTPVKKTTQAAASSSTSYGRPRTNSMLKVDPKVANASGSVPFDNPSPEPSFSTTSATASSSTTASHPFARHAQQRAGNETPSFAVIDSFSKEQYSPGDLDQDDGPGSSYGLGLGMPATYAEDARTRAAANDTGARWADIDDGVRTGRSASWTNTFVGEMSSKKQKLWLKAPKGGKRRVSDGLLSPAHTSPPRSRQAISTRALYRRRLNLALARLPFFAKLSPSVREFVAGLLALVGLFYVLHVLSPAFEPLLSSASSSSHHQDAFISSHLGEGRVQAPFDPPPDSAPERYPNPRLQQQPAAVPLAPGRAGGKWVWKSKREELGSLVQYIASSDMHSLPVVNVKKPLDPQLVLDFNPFSSRGPKMVAQMVDDFWTGKGEGASGQLLIIGRGRDPSVFTIRALIESLALEAPIMFLDLEGRADSYHLSAVLLRIMGVPRLPVLVIGGHVVGDFFAVRKAQLDKSFDKLLDDADIAYTPPSESSVPPRGMPAHLYPEPVPPPPVPAPIVPPPVGQVRYAGSGSEEDETEPEKLEDDDEYEDEEEEVYEWDEEYEDEEEGDDTARTKADEVDDGPHLGLGMKIGFDDDDFEDY